MEGPEKSDTCLPPEAPPKSLAPREPHLGTSKLRLRSSSLALRLRSESTCIHFVLGTNQKVVVKVDVNDGQDKRRAMEAVSSFKGKKSSLYLSLNL
ncbi:hypothetical protein OPV22_011163 [Ensete ventricosum]|uniref:Uncharacterized protein n=1 Tax=Ensete ventricosum TaxID=4639 RepID=A0AAV8RCV3_ENSVE|nr:hypothetical protein OPV22_011163 [Ensete ventricosum]